MPDPAATSMHAVEGRVVLVTGAARGVGRGIAHHLAAGGASVVAVDRDRDGLATVAAELGGRGGPHLAVPADIMVRAEVDAMVGAAVERFGRLDALVNNAQTFRPTAPMESVTDDDLEVFWRSGVQATLWAMQAAHPHMRRRGWGRIVNFASAMGIVGGRGFGAYNASKEAIRALTRTAAREWAADGIVVNCVAPAAAAHHGEAARRSEGYRQFVESCPMGRQGDPELDIGPVVWFLCSDACRYLTGHTFMVDGGAFMWA